MNDVDQTNPGNPNNEKENTMTQMKAIKFPFKADATKAVCHLDLPINSGIFRVSFVTHQENFSHLMNNAFEVKGLKREEVALAIDDLGAEGLKREANIRDTRSLKVKRVTITVEKDVFGASVWTSNHKSTGVYRGRSDVSLLAGPTHIAVRRAFLKAAKQGFEFVTPKPRAKANDPVAKPADKSSFSG